MGKFFVCGCLVLTLLIASPAMAQDGKATGKKVGNEAGTSLGFGGNTSEGPSTFFFELLGYGGDTGEGPSTFLFESLGYGGDTGTGPSTFFMQAMRWIIFGIHAGSQPSGI